MQKIPPLLALSSLLLAAAFVCAVFFRGTDSVLYAPAFVSLAVFSGLTVFSAAKSGALFLPRNALSFLVLAFGIYMGASVLWSSAPYLSTIFASIICVLPFLFLVLTLAPDFERTMRFYAAALGAIIAAFAAWALVQFFFFFDEYGPRIRHPMLNPNDLAALFSMALVPCAGLLFFARGKNTAVAFALFALLYGALIVTQSRGAMLAVLLSMAVLLPFAAAGRPVPWARLGGFLALMAAVPFLINFAAEGGALKSNLASLPHVLETRSAGDRILLWSSTWAMIRDHFWGGTGLGTFYFYYPQYREPLDRSDGFFAHMDPLQFWAETGVAAPALFYAVLVAALLRTIGALRAAGATREQRFAVMAPFCAMLAPLLNTHISFHLYMPGILIPLALLFALWYAATENILGAADRAAADVKTPGVKIAIAVFAMLCLLTAGWLMRWAGAVYNIREVQKIVGRPGYDGADVEKTLARARAIAPPSYSKYYEYEARAVAAQLWGQAHRLPPEEVRDLYAKGMAFLDEAEKRNPAYTGVWDLRARLYYAADGIAVENGKEKARAELERVLKANPLSVDSRIGLANILKARGDLAGASAVLEEGLLWPRPRGQADVTFMFAAAQARLALGDRKGHDALAHEALARAKSYGIIKSGK